MKYKVSLIFVLTILCSMGPLRAEESTLKPWIPTTQHSLTAGGVAVGIVAQVPKSQAAALPLVHFSASQPACALNHLKGEFGEGMMDAVFTSRMLRTTGGWSLATPAHTGRAGIDGLYFKMDSSGNIRDMLVADAKYGSARLGQTLDGPQMSDTWIKPRLQKTAKMYRSLIAELETGKIAPANGAAKNAAVNRVTIPLNDRTNIELWKTRDGLRYFCFDKTISAKDIERQLKGAARYLDEAAAGNAKFRPRLFSYSPLGNEHVFTIKTLDTNANVVKTNRIQGTFNRLPVEYQRTVQSQVRRALLVAGKSPEDVHRLTREICNDPVKFNQLCVQPRHSFRAGLDTGAMRIAGIIGVAVTGIDAVSQYWENGKVDVSRLLTMGVLAGGSTVVGNYVGTQSSLLLSKFSPMLTKYAGPVFGGGLGGVILSYGMYAAGYVDSRTAHVGAITSVGAAAVTPIAYGIAYNGAMAIAMTYGTASTGTAISTLSGAAATKAGAAWLGGGALSAGGGGAAAAGSSILVTGGTAVVVIVAAVAIERTVHYAFYFKDERDKQRYIAGIVDYTHRRVQEGKQIEWQ